MHSISIILSILKLHMYIVIVLANLNAGYNNLNSNEFFFLKNTRASFYSKNFKKLIHAEF